MARKKVKKAGKTRGRINLVASILIGLTLLVSGTGKILGIEETPAQVVDFISNFLPSIFITPATIYFLFDVFVPVVIPWVEVILGACLLIGFLPRLMAVLYLPLLAAFMGTNLWSIMQGGYTTCASCFGIWEQYFGSLTPTQSLIYDLVLLALAIVIIIFQPRGFLSSREWLAKRRKFDAATLKPKIRAFSRQLQKLGAKTMVYLNLTLKKAKEHPRIALATGVCLLVLIACGITLVSISPAIPKNGARVEVPVVSDTSVSELSETSAAISWMTDRPTISSIEIYSEDGTFIITITDKKPATTHRLLVAGLTSGTNYYFRILSEDKQAISGEHSFSTLAEVISPLTISDVEVSYVTNTDATITWVTNRPATSEVQYWDPISIDRLTVSSDEFNTNHAINLTSLKAGAIYHYQIKSTDAEGDHATSSRLAMSPLIGKPAPGFTLNSLDGRTITLSDYRGKWVMLDFWIWTCSACRAKLPLIQEVYTRIPKGKLAILGIHYLGRESIIRTYVKGENLAFPVLLDSESVVCDLYNVHAFPTIFLIDGDGIIRLIDPEFSSAEELENILNTMLDDT
ncbi:MAG: redoxin domain-containing protein [Chloroflexi bacterium]|nr:redoxin domain-containing protein [Chloroflexota bacterium]